MSRRECLAFVAAALLVVLVFMTGALGKQQVWSEMSYRYMDFEGDKLAYDLAAGDSYGVVSRGPDFDLPAGTYRLKIRVFADGDNVVRFEAKNGAVIEPAQVTLDHDVLDFETEITIREFAEDVAFLVDFCDGTRMEFADIRVYSPAYADNAFTLLFLAVGLCLAYLLWSRGYLTAQRRGTLILIAVAVIYASAPSLKENLTMVIDSRFHLARIANLADGLAHGQFPVRCGGFSYDGYGAVTSAFYPDLFLYPSALMMNAGASVQYAVHVFHITLNIAAAWTAYAAVKRMTGDRQAAACASVLYVLSIYRITDIYTRGAFGEAAAMSVLPAFILGLWEVIFGDRDRWWVLGLSAAGIFLSHMLSTIMCAGLAVCLCAAFIVRIVRERRILPLIKAACLALGLCMFFLAPFITYSLQGIGAASLRKSIANDVLAPAQLFLLGAGDMPVNPKDHDLSGLALEIGVPLVIGAALALYRCATAEKKERGAREALLLTAVGAVSALMCTTMFPWGYVSKLTLGLADYIQFPWRFMMFTAAAFSMAGGWGYAKLAEGKKDAGVVLALAIALFAALPAISDQTRANSFLAYGQGVSPHLTYYEYTLPGTDVNATRDRAVLTEGDVAVTDYVKDGTNVTARVKADAAAKVSFPLFGFDGYRAALDGKEIAWTLGENNRLTVALEAGQSGTLRVWYAGKALWRIADAVSLVTAAGMITLHIRRRRAVCRS